MKIGQAIQKIRKERGISQGEFAASCGLAQTSLSQIEKGHRRASTQNFKIICERLGVPETIIYLEAMEESDVPERKKEIYRILYPMVQTLIKQFITEDTK